MVNWKNIKVWQFVPCKPKGFSTLEELKHEKGV